LGKPLPDIVQKTSSRPAPAADVSLDGPKGKDLARILDRPIRNGAINVRGKQDIEIYRNASSSVVLVENKVGFGSGTLVAPNLILTNAHVVGRDDRVAIVFKPQRDENNIKPSEIIIGKVLRTDVGHDLGLVRVDAVPSYVRPLTMGTDKDIEIGADVHAIGHPRGEIWTYTKGIISQFRKNYTWRTEDGAHRADVIQTQTPINPGNSGGPLISSSGRLIGVNAFKKGEPESEGLNFAVAVDDALRFINSDYDDRSKSRAASTCKPVRLFEGRNKDNNAKIALVDSNCDGKPDISLVVPDDQGKPISALVDSNFDGKTDIIVEDRNRDGRWDISFIDTDFDGVIDLVGFHPDGEITPTRVEKYDAQRSY
jgi:S1-C subfamily serine protease